MVITINMIATAYKYAVLVYKGNLGRFVAETQIHNESGLCRGSAQAYIQIFLCMMKGQVYKRTMSLYSHHYFLENIHNDFGQAAFQKALLATDAHIKYYASLGRGHLLGVEGLIKELNRPEAII